MPRMFFETTKTNAPDFLDGDSDMPYSDMQEVPMEAEKTSKHTMVKTVLIVALITFAAGFGLGFYVFSYHKNEQKDYKESLRETISYITDLENKNIANEKELVALRGETAPNTAAQPEAPQDKVSSLERENNALRTAMNQSQALIQQNNDLRLQIQNLQAQLGATRPGGMAHQPPIPQASPQPAPSQAQPYAPQPVR